MSRGSATCSAAPRERWCTRLERMRALAIPVLVLIGRENVAASDLDDALLGELADTLAATAMGGA